MNNNQIKPVCALCFSRCVRSWVGNSRAWPVAIPGPTSLMFSSGPSSSFSPPSSCPPSSSSSRRSATSPPRCVTLYRCFAGWRTCARLVAFTFSLSLSRHRMFARCESLVIRRPRGRTRSPLSLCALRRQVLPLFWLVVLGLHSNRVINLLPPPPPDQQGRPLAR